MTDRLNPIDRIESDIHDWTILRCINLRPETRRDLAEFLIERAIGDGLSDQARPTHGEPIGPDSP